MRRNKMQYRTLVKDAPEVSLLGYGCMRFPTKGGGIDKELTFEQLKYAYDNGVNYLIPYTHITGGKARWF